MWNAQKHANSTIYELGNLTSMILKPILFQLNIRVSAISFIFGLRLKGTPENWSSEAINQPFEFLLFIPPVFCSSS